MKKDDPIKFRRIMAFAAAFHGFFAFPYVIAVFSKHYQVSDELCSSLLHYMIVLSTGPLAAYFIAAHRQDGMTMKDFAMVAEAAGHGDQSDPAIIPGADGSSAVAGTEGE